MDGHAMMPMDEQAMMAMDAMNSTDHSMHSMNMIGHQVSAAGALL